MSTGHDMNDATLPTPVSAGVEELLEEVSAIAEQMRLQQAELDRLRASVVALGTVTPAGDSSEQVAAAQRTADPSNNARNGASTRRQLLRTGAAALGAGVAVVGLGSKPAAADDGDFLEIGTTNVGESPTSLFAAVTAGTVFTAVNNATTGFAHGVVGRANSASGIGVVAENGAATGAAVGLSATSSSPTGTAVEGTALSATGAVRGVAGRAFSPTGFGVLGVNSATGASVGVRGESSSPDGIAIQGEALSGDNAVGVEGTGVGAGVVGLGERVGVFGDGGDIGSAFQGGDFGVIAVGDVLLTDVQNSHVSPPMSEAPLHVARSGSANPVELMLQLESDVAPQQTFVNSDSGAKWFFAMTSDDEFKISRAGTGKVEAKFFENGNLRLAGSLIQTSDVHVKHDVEPVDAGEILDKLATLPVSTWRYDRDPAAKHLGPTAQDFAAAFGLGTTTTGIAAVDADGVALAAIQALHARTTEQAAENSRLRAELEELKLALGE